MGQAKKLKAKLNKEKKKEKQFYTAEERLTKIIELKNKLMYFNLYTACPDELAEVDDMMNDFVKNGTSYYKKIKLEKANRVMEIEFNNEKRYVPTIKLIYKEWGQRSSPP